MNNSDELLRRAMELPPEARAALAESLLESLEGPTDPDAETAWAIEIKRRLSELENGTVRGLSFAEAQRKIFG
ncbi:MAG: addiction module protein [Planctomycetes bacterium]|nr:addiction module protein [Planctomycetota bacterium]